MQHTYFGSREFIKERDTDQKKSPADDRRGFGVGRTRLEVQSRIENEASHAAVSTKVGAAGQIRPRLVNDRHVHGPADVARHRLIAVAVSHGGS